MQRGTSRRDDVYAFITTHIIEHGFAPSVDEVALELGTVKSNIHYHLRVLEREGRMAHNPNVARSWRPVR